LAVCRGTATAGAVFVAAIAAVAITTINCISSSNSCSRILRVHAHARARAYSRTVTVIVIVTIVGVMSCLLFLALLLIDLVVEGGRVHPSYTIVTNERKNTQKKATGASETRSKRRNKRHTYWQW
jgi:hypothetical protein